jgi:hypothetical protein
MAGPFCRWQSDSNQSDGDGRRIPGPLPAGFLIPSLPLKPKTGTQPNSFHLVAQKVLNTRPARTEDENALTVPPPPTLPERRLPLRQPPSEQPFSASPQNVDPVRNDWVLPHLAPILFFDAFPQLTRKTLGPSALAGLWYSSLMYAI